MKPYIYLMKTITNMYVGDMGSNVSIVDKQVQKDVVSGYPTINASSLKGALREHVQAYEAKNKDKLSLLCKDIVFGKEGEQEKKQDGKMIREAQSSVKGKVNFLNAQLLFFPLRGNDMPYYLATCPLLISELNERLQSCGVKGDIAKAVDALDAYLLNKKQLAWQQTDGNDCILLSSIDKVSPLFDELYSNEKATYLVIPDVAFKEHMEEIPIVARNQLENGVSNNLWYEEYVPRKSMFVLTMLAADGSIPKRDEKENKTPTMADIMGCFKKAICGDELVQVGGNATVGDGLCKIMPMGGGHEQ